MQIPVQLQTQREGVMATEPGTSTQDTDKCQVSVYDSDASSVDIDELVNQSDNDLDSDTPSTKYCKFSNDRPVLDSSNPSVTQDTINQAILTQLASIGKRLDNIEKSNVCKKSVDTAKIKNRPKRRSVQASKNVPGHNYDASNEQKTLLEQSVPPLSTLRSDKLIQQQVAERLKELSSLSQGTETKIKSQRGGPVDIFVKNRVKWSHEFVLAGPSKERLSYNNLTMLQWVAGFCRTMKEEHDMSVREHMLDYMISLLDDAQDFSWQVAKPATPFFCVVWSRGRLQIGVR